MLGNDDYHIDKFTICGIEVHNYLFYQTTALEFLKFVRFFKIRSGGTGCKLNFEFEFLCRGSILASGRFSLVDWTISTLNLFMIVALDMGECSLLPS